MNMNREDYTPQWLSICILQPKNCSTRLSLHIQPPISAIYHHGTSLEALRGLSISVFFWIECSCSSMVASFFFFRFDNHCYGACYRACSCLLCRKLNEMTKVDSYPIPLIEEILVQACLLKGNLEHKRNGYYQLRQRFDSKQLFRGIENTFEWNL